MNRRELLIGAGLALTATARALADKPTMSPAAAAAARLAGVAAAASHCVPVARACLNHCLEMFAGGNASMSGCARAVMDLAPAVEALAAIASTPSRHAAPLAKVVAEIAKDCKAECDKHLAMGPCKACADSCAALLAEIAKI